MVNMYRLFNTVSGEYYGDFCHTRSGCKSKFAHDTWLKRRSGIPAGRRFDDQNIFVIHKFDVVKSEDQS